MNRQIIKEEKIISLDEIFKLIFKDQIENNSNLEYLNQDFLYKETFLKNKIIDLITLKYSQKLLYFYDYYKQDYHYFVYPDELDYIIINYDFNRFSSNYPVLENTHKNKYSKECNEHYPSTINDYNKTKEIYDFIFSDQLSKVKPVTLESLDYEYPTKTYFNPIKPLLNNNYDQYLLYFILQKAASNFGPAPDEIEQEKRETWSLLYPDELELFYNKFSFSSLRIKLPYMKKKGEIKK